MLTASAKAIVGELARMRKTSPFDQAIKKCVVLEPNTILIYYENGDMALFGLGKMVSLDPKQNEAKAEEITEKDDRDNAPASHMGNEQERRLFGELQETWHNTGLPDDLSPQDLIHADALVQEMLATTPSDDIQLAAYNSLGLKGNRYLALIKRLSDLSPDAEITFYEGYLDNATSDMRLEDVPTDREKQAVIKRLMAIFAVGEQPRQYRFSSEVSEEIQRLDPTAYEVFSQNGVVTRKIAKQPKSPQ